jgi:hypothetical protein
MEQVLNGFLVRRDTGIQDIAARKYENKRVSSIRVTVQALIGVSFAVYHLLFFSGT